MGIIAESIATYAQPLLDNTDSSIEQMNEAFTIGQICWNLAIMPKEARAEALREMATSLKMEADEFEVFQRDVIIPMIRRHEEMFPRMHEPGTMGGGNRNFSPTPPTATPPPVPREKYPGTGRNEPCPCNSGKKYKKCCGQ